MTNSITNIAPDNVPELSYRGKPVVTTSVLAALYGTEAKYIQNNYKRNEARFEEGKHYFKVTGNELKELKKQPSLRGLVSKMVSHLLLYTERGAARHAKMLETDAAWDVFEALEDNYFGKGYVHDGHTLEAKRIGKTTTQDRAPLKQLVNTIVDARTRRGHPSDYSSAWREINGYLGLESIQDATHEQIETGITFARKVLEGELCSPQASLPDNSQESVFGDDDMSDIYILLCHAHIIEKKWRESHIEEALSILHAPIGGNLHENIQMAASFARRIAKAKGQLMERSRERLGLNYGLIPTH
ncbi:ORF6N domain-containing protein [Vreelandella maris]|uniref:ORF6N domain-containing protein n=1 Tax=Vreelandella maris TaxID=2729617 RepID=UPI0030EEC59A